MCKFVEVDRHYLVHVRALCTIGKMIREAFHEPCVSLLCEGSPLLSVISELAHAQERLRT